MPRQEGRTKNRIDLLPGSFDMTSVASQPAGDKRTSQVTERETRNSNTAKVAHTLTACCRCRQVRTHRRWFSPGHFRSIADCLVSCC